MKNFKTFGWWWAWWCVFAGAFLVATLALWGLVMLARVLGSAAVG